MGVLINHFLLPTPPFFAIYACTLNNDPDVCASLSWFSVHLSSYLDGNNLEGQIPTEIGNCVALVYLYACLLVAVSLLFYCVCAINDIKRSSLQLRSVAYINGAIICYADHTMLTRLLFVSLFLHCQPNTSKLNNNQLSGEIPLSISKCAALTEL